MVRKRKGRALKKNLQVPDEDGADVLQAPHSFVIHRGLACPYITDLTKDFRRIMEPFTAMKLKERKSNKIKDYVSLSGHFHVSHMCIFNKASTQLSFKVMRLPRGPTLTFKVHQFTLARDVISSARKQYFDEESFNHAPLVVMNNFAGEGNHLKLMASTFQNMFPTISLATINLATIRRCVLFSYNPVTKLVDMRHYSIIAVPVGLSRGVKKVVMGKVPNLSRCEDIADLFASGAVSDSEFEDDEASQVVLPQDLKRKGNMENNKSAIRLYEIGPRMTFELVKIEDGLLTGEVLYHDTVVKTEEEIEAIRKQREKKKKLKDYRRKQQDENKARKEKTEFKKKRPPRPHMEEVEPDNDADYYREEVGEEPDEELFKYSEDNSRKRVRVPKYMGNKRRKLDKKPKRDDEKDFKKGKSARGDREKDFKKGKSARGDREKDFRKGKGARGDRDGDRKKSGSKFTFKGGMNMNRKKISKGRKSR